MFIQSSRKNSCSLPYVILSAVRTVHLVHNTTLLEGVGSVFDFGELTTERVGGFMEDMTSMLLEGSGQPLGDTFDVGDAHFDTVSAVGLGGYAWRTGSVPHPRGVSIGRESGQDVFLFLRCDVMAGDPITTLTALSMTFDVIPFSVSM